MIIYIYIYIYCIVLRCIVLCCRRVSGAGVGSMRYYVEEEDEEAGGGGMRKRRVLQAETDGLAEARGPFEEVQLLFDNSFSWLTPKLLRCVSDRLISQCGVSHVCVVEKLMTTSWRLRVLVNVNASHVADMKFLWNLWRRKRTLPAQSRLLSQSPLLRVLT
jgi:hypothetical protein